MQSRLDLPCRALFILLSLTGLSTSGTAQTPDSVKSTRDLEILVGTWQIERINDPRGQSPKSTQGTLTCQYALDKKFIHCRYEMQRPGKIRGLDEVYFNYNGIYNQYESMWLSSTWPVKVLLQGELIMQANQQILNTKASFPIDGGRMEYVRDEMTLKIEKSSVGSFQRETFIRTSDDAEGVWKHHMTEIAKRKE